MLTRLILILLTLAAMFSSAVAGNVVSLTDPIGDDNGPGHYSRPTGVAFRNASFDITSFDVSLYGTFVVFSIKFKDNFSSPIGMNGPNGESLAGKYGTKLWLENIDIYIDRDHIAGSGLPAALPGRKVNFAHDSYWDKAVLITPRPALVREELSSIAPELLSSVIVCTDVNRNLCTTINTRHFVLVDMQASTVSQVEIRSRILCHGEWIRILHAATANG